LNGATTTHEKNSCIFRYGVNTRTYGYTLQLLPSSNIRMARWEEHVADMGEEKFAFTLLEGKYQGMVPLG
jgi:hypothetical protein